MLSAFLLALFVGVSSAASSTFCPAEVTKPLAGLPSAAISISLLALSLSFDVVAVGYMLSKIFPAAGIRNWLQNEYWEIAKSAMLIAGIYLAITFISSIALFIVPGAAAPSASYVNNIGTLYSESYTYLNTVCGNLVNIWNGVSTLGIAIGLYQGLSISLYVPIPIPFVGAFLTGFSVTPIYTTYLLESGNHIIAQYESMLNDMIKFILFPTSLLTVGLMYNLYSIIEASLTMIIPLGLVFRAFPFSRNIGGTLIAIGIGAGIVYPAILVLFNYPLTQAITPYVYVAPTPGPSTGNLLPTSGNGFFLDTGAEIIDTIFKLTIGPIVNLAQYAGIGANIFNGVYYFYNYILNYGFYMILQFFIFAVDLMILYPIVDSIARSLGGTLRLSLGSKLKLA
jgi:hypothetical protein